MNYAHNIEAKKTVLVTGGTGLLGNRLCHFLIHHGYQVVLLTRSRDRLQNLPQGIRVVNADLSEKLNLSKEDLGPIHIVVHLAQADGHSDFLQSAAKMVAVTINSLCQLAELACTLGVEKFILASSGGVYGGGVDKFSETDTLNNSDSLSFYLATKKAAEDLIKYFDPYLKITMLRYFFIYGPEQKSEMLIPRMRDSILSRKEITMASNTGPYINPIYVDDAAKATLACLGSETPKVINIAGDEIVSLKEICELIGKSVDIKPKFIIKEGVATNFIGNNSLMRQQLHIPEVKLEEGLKSLLTNAK